MKISEVEKITGLTAKAIRLYEKKGLISVARKDNSYRNYSREDADKLNFIRELREIGISLSQICLYFNDVISLEEVLNNRKLELDKENVFHRKSYDKCVNLLNSLKPNGAEFEHINENETNALLGLDIGTTNIKAVVLDYGTGDVIETCSVPNNFKLQCDSDFSEFDADRIADKVKRISDYLIRTYPNIKSIGITGQMHGIVYISSSGKAASPFYNWQDGRGNRKYSESETYCGEILNRTGYVCSTGYAFSTLFYNKLNKLEPQNAKTFCSIMDYVVMILSGRSMPLIHISNAAAFGLFDIKHNSFDTTAIDKLGLSDYILPKLTSKAEIAGEYKGIPICVAIGDSQASFFGSVAEESSGVLVNFGTGSQVMTAIDEIDNMSDELEIRPYLFDKYLICGSALCGGKAYAIIEKFFSEYVNEVTGKAEEQYEIMNALAERAYSEGMSLSVSTLFCGTRQNPSVRGSISGINDMNFTPGNLILGVMQGMVTELHTYFKRIGQKKTGRITASGNAVKKNRILQRILKDIFEAELMLTDNDEEAAMGSALYAGVAGSVLTVSQAKKLIKGRLQNE